MSQNLPKRSLGDVLSLRHPNHFVFAGANNRNVIITYQFPSAPFQANRDFFLAYWLLTVYFNCKYFPSGFRLLGEIPAGAIINTSAVENDNNKIYEKKKWVQAKWKRATIQKQKIHFNNIMSIILCFCAQAKTRNIITHAPQTVQNCEWCATY